MSAVFEKENISDQKRFVRGEQLLLARSVLRSRDKAHNKPWRVLMLPGRDPREEIDAIRELMPNAHITAVDRDDASLLSAIDFGANEVVCCNLEDFGVMDFGGRCVPRKVPASEIAQLEKFDLLILDLCSNANETTQKIASVYRSMVASRGVMIFNFSYGRDVVEVFHDCEQRGKNSHLGEITNALAKGVIIFAVPTVGA